MSVEDMKQRYLNIAKQSLQFLTDKDFKKKGMKYSKEKGELILEITPAVSRPWSNSESLYEFEITWELNTTNPNYVSVYSFAEEEKNLTKAPLLWSLILPKNYDKGVLFLHDDDPPGQDESFIAGIKEKIEFEVIPWFNTIHSLHDILHIIEEEYKVEKEKRKFYRHQNISYTLANFYAANGWQDKTIEICDKYIERSDQEIRDLAEKRKKKYLKYFEQDHARNIKSN